MANASCARVIAGGQAVRVVLLPPSCEIDATRVAQTIVTNNWIVALVMRDEEKPCRSLGTEKSGDR